jgi:enediyne biosynthesis protein E4
VRGATLAVACLAALVNAAALAPPWSLVDRTAEAGLDFTHFNGMSGELYFVEMVGAGAALLDYDGDGDLDLYAVQGSMLGEAPVAAAVFPPRHPLPLTDRLYRNDLQAGPDDRPRIVFHDVTERAGLVPTSYGQGVTVGDFDNDGLPDLYLAAFGENRLLHNTGDGRFETRQEAVGAAIDWSVSAAAVDFDRDGWLDLYVTNYVDFRLATHKQCKSEVGTADYCGPLAYPASPDALYHNRGDGTFEDVSGPSGVGAVAGSTLGVVSGDFDADGWPDFYAANDQMANFLWLNQRDGTFRDAATLAGVAVNAAGQPEASMGVVADDLDGSGSEDLFVTHLTKETNTLYLDDGGGFFVDATQRSGLGRPSFPHTGFGVAAVDIDLDGDLDLAVADGAVRRIEEQVRAGSLHPLAEPNLLFRNVGGGRFENASEAGGPAFTTAETSRGVAAGDLDDDGDADLVLTGNAEAARLVMNETVSGHRWLALRVLTADGRDALGAEAVVRTARGATRHRVHTDGSYASARDPRVQVGLGDAAPLAVSLVWPTGERMRLEAPPTDRYLTLRQTGGGR